MTGSNPKAGHPLGWAPNALTLARVGLAPVILVMLMLAGLDDASASGRLILLAGLAIALAGVFDFLDGRLARAWGVESAFGQFWDPIADKLVVGAGLIGVSVLAPLVAPAALAIIARDIVITALRAGSKSGVAQRIQAPSALAKWKTALEYVALGGMLLALLAASQTGVWISAALIYAAAGLAVWTGHAYWRAAHRR